MADMKKDFQKVVKAYRDTLPDVTWYLSGGKTEQHRPEIPKAMMTEQQMRKGTATVNCGFGEQSIERAEAVKDYPPFVAWCKTYGIKTVVIERVKYYDNFQGQIRVTY
jgi:hypothetical protein